MKKTGDADNDTMQESPEELRRRMARAMRGERTAMARLNDILHKYRVLLPHMAERTKTLEERLALITANRDECGATLAALRGRIGLSQSRLKQNEADLAGSERLLNSLDARYNGMMEGKFPRSFAPEDGKNPAERKKRFMERLSEEMDRLQRELERVQGENARLADDRKKLRSSLARLQKRAKMQETKLALYQKDIRDIILDINGQARNEQAAIEDFSRLVEQLQKLPGLSEWAEKVFRETVTARMASGGLLELGKPLAGKGILSLGSSRRVGPPQ